MLADPQSITVSGSAKSLARTGSSTNAAEYATSDRAYQLSVQHIYGKRTRHQARFKFDSLVANPLVSGQNVNQSMSVMLTIDVPNGYDTTTSKAVADGFIAFLAASTGAAVGKIVGGES